MKMESKYTPGPWKATCADPEYDPRYWIEAKGEFNIVATTAMGNDEANAHLIAAAPELLEILQTIVIGYDLDGTILKRDIVVARQAIAKAEPK